ncbi:uncharacterized protein LOC104895808 [Beta vulgaris subsp. vulgaris]|uniref:uncharacterized protein LOC104895808 n=1 Tax=Beta vulgaris subsp. vulgaris TaxID=3555 RepID=UPI0025494AC1|nr:uncharacterized protein LOC104895808 [Beta vulgaris subsp. vulgaris]
MEIVVADDSFKKPGAIPFTWETRPGVSKFQQHYTHELAPPLISSSSSSPALSKSSSFSSSPSRELQAQWVKSMSLPSNTKNFPSSLLTRLQLISGHKSGCFPISWLRWKWGKEKRVAKPKLKVKLELDPECIKDYTFYLEKLARWSMTSSGKSSSSSFSWHVQRSSPQPTKNDDDDDDEAARSRVLHSLFGFLRRPKMIGMEGMGGEKKQVNISVYLVNNQV